MLLIGQTNHSAGGGATTNKATTWSSEWFTPLRFGLILGFSLAVTFWKVATGQHSFFFRDYGVIGYPFIYYHHQSFWQGDWPLWNPYSNCGAPFLAQWGTMVLYPFSLIYLLFPLPWSLSYFCLGHLLLAGMGMYFLAYRWVGNRFGASLAGFGYIFNGVTFSSLIWPNYAVALAWMPFVVLLTEQGWREGGRRLIAAALVSALQVMSGVPELVAMTWLLVAGVWLLSFVQGQPSRWQISSRILGMVLLVTGLTAAQMLPFFDLLAHSQRDHGFVGSKWAMPGWGWANLLLPAFHSFETPQGQFFQYGQEFLSSYYLGIGILTLGIIAAWRVRQGKVWLLASLTGISLILALGESGYLYLWLRNLIPALGIGRYPVKFVFLAAFAVPLLAAYAIQLIEDRAPSIRTSLHRSLWWLFAAAGLMMFALLQEARHYPLAYDQWEATWKNGLVRMMLLLGFLALLNWRTKLLSPLVQIILSVGLLVAQGLDILTHTPTQNPTLPVSVFQPGIWEASFPFSPPKHGNDRIMISPEAEQALTKNSIRDPAEQFIGKRLALWSNLNLLETIPKVNGSSTLQVREQMQVQNMLYGSKNSTPPGLLDFLGVSLLTTAGKIVEWSPRESWLPLVTIGAKPIFTEATNALAAMFAPGFDPRREVFLPVEAQSSVTVTNPTSARITSRQHTAQRISLSVTAEQASLIVIAQSFYDSWHAYVDGQAVPLWRANVAFQALEVPAGPHQVELVYRDGKFYLGAISTISTLGCCVALVARRRRVTGCGRQ